MLGVPSGYLKRFGAMIIDILVLIVFYYAANLAIVTPIMNATSNYEAKKNQANEEQDEFNNLLINYHIGNFGYFLDDKGNEKDPVFFYDARFVDMSKVYASDAYKNFIKDEDVIAIYEELYVFAEKYNLGTISDEGKTFTLSPNFNDDNKLEESDEYKDFMADPEVITHVVSLYPKADKYELGQLDSKGNFFFSSSFYITNDEFIKRPEYIAFMADTRVIEILALRNEATNLINIAFIASLFIASIIALYLPNLFFKKGKSLGKFLFRLSVVHKHDYVASQLHIFLRVFAIFGIELSLVYILMTYFGQSLFTVALMIPFLSITIMLFSKDRKTLHDVIASTKVTEDSKSKVFADLDERNAYVEEMNNKSDDLPRLDAPKRDDDLITNLVDDKGK